jgi:hypothetical protein
MPERVSQILSGAFDSRESPRVGAFFSQTQQIAKAAVSRPDSLCVV